MCVWVCLCLCWPRWPTASAVAPCPLKVLPPPQHHSRREDPVFQENTCDAFPILEAYTFQNNLQLYNNLKLWRFKRNSLLFFRCPSPRHVSSVKLPLGQISCYKRLKLKDKTTVSLVLTHAHTLSLSLYFSLPIPLHPFTIHYHKLGLNKIAIQR